MERPQIPTPPLDEKTTAAGYVDYINKQALLNTEKYIAQHAEGRWKSHEFARDFGMNVIKTLLLLNAGAILAVLTFAGNLYAKDGFKIEIAIAFGRSIEPSIYFFISGIVLSVLTSFMGYLNWTSVGSGYLGPAELFEWVKGTEMKPRGGRLVQPTMIAAVILGLLSLGCFLTGAIKVVLAFHVLGVS